MTNFNFLKSEWTSIYDKIIKAEERVNSEPVSTASYCRLVLEECINLLYDIEYIERPYNKELVNLMSQTEIKDLIPFSHINGLHIVRKTGNNAAHYGQRVSSNDALISIKYIYSFLKWFAGNYSKSTPELPAAFDESFIPKIGAPKRQLKLLQQEHEKEEATLKAQIEALLEEKKAILAKAQESEMALSVFKQKQELAKKELQEQKQERHIAIASEFTEAETRKHLIDVNLKEVGWDNLRNGRELEYPVTGMPITSDNPKGNGFVDYVLWDDNAKPLAIIEAKRTTKDAENGKYQAFLYANCLEKMHGQRPMIFYTNGYENFVWDDTFYSTPRRVFGFFTKDELQWKIQQRQTRKDLRKSTVNTHIAGRPYQIEGIQRINEALITDSIQGIRGNKRQVLMVMATGTGKTRLAIAQIDILLKYNWVKRVLFLADRNALVRQAMKNFGELLPEITSIDLTKEKENDTTRLVFSTYQSIMNRIDNIRSNEERFYGVGHFDLIIIDEAHRSVYNRYKAIFDYFDALIIGLTATPKDSIDHNTFELFSCSTGDATFEYELDKAVEANFLTPYKNLDVSTDFIREGIKYNQLSDEEKAKYEESFRDKSTGLFPEEIPANAMNKWLFNEDTAYKVLDAIMENGQKIEGGDKMGRTIIFAVNQNHAKFIVDCFTKRYPEQPSGFIAMIHNEVSHAQSLIEAFCDQHKENYPQIVVSVDMMDTGIDAPRVLNLVFFKIVRSYAKFWQMIGRGTRLCPDAFGPAQPKEYFLIFDVCQNFEFFEVNKKGDESGALKTLSQQIFETRLRVSRLLAETGETENIELSNKLLDILHASIANLDKNLFRVAMNLRYVDEFKERKRWNNLSSDDVHNIEEHLSALPTPETINEIARRFDLMMLKLQLANLLMLSSEKRFHQNLLNIAEILGTKYTIPEVLRSKELIESLKNPEFYKKLTHKKIDSIREEIRELVKYLENAGRQPIYTNIEDSEVVLTLGEALANYGTGSLYKKRVESFIRENKHHIAISKLSTNKPITHDELVALEAILFDGDERGSKEDFEKEFGKQPLGTFIRSIIGLDIEAANTAFAGYMQTGNLRADQMTFINTIISYLTKNGTIDKRMLFEPPFTDQHDQGLMGIFDDDADSMRIIRIIDEINNNAITA